MCETSGSSANDAGGQPVLSEYEQSRARNIERNNARLRSLGLITIAEERRSNDSAWGRNTLTCNDDEEEDTEGKKSATKKKKKRSQSSALLPPREGSRKSRRLMNLPTEYASGDIGDDDDHETPTETAEERKERIQKERDEWVDECREARQRAAIEVAKAGAESTGKKNPTATYEHCLMRVRSMNEKGLANRVSAEDIVLNFWGLH